jgi:hypothetical protein
METRTKTADQATSLASLSDVTDLVAPMEANKRYIFEAFVVYSSAGLLAGIHLDFAGPAGPTSVVWSRETAITAVVGTDIYESAVRTAYESDSPTAGVDAAGARRTARLRGVVENGATAGDLKLRFATGLAGTNVTVHAGSWIRAGVA